MHDIPALAPTSHPQSGMTLVETMVALAIIGVMSGIAVLSIGAADRGRGAETEAMRLSARLGLAVDLALIDGRDIQLEWDTTGYRFVQSDADAASSPLDGRHDLASGLRLTSSGALAVSDDSAINPADFVFQGAGPAWRVTFNGIDASAEPLNPP